MSQSPIIRHRKSGEEVLTMMSEGLVDAFNGESMGLIGETIAEQFEISREEQDRFAQRSQEKL